MSDLELSFVNYLFTDRPPVALLKSYRPELKIKDKRILNVVDYLCTLPENRTVPDYLTATSLLSKDQDALDILGEAVGTEKAAPDMEDFSLLLSVKDIEEREARVSANLKRALDENDNEKAIQYAEELSQLAREGRIRVGPIAVSEFFDMKQILKPEEFLSSHIPRLNQHLGGWPDDIDFEERGGFTLGEITLISASTNKGKSALATSIWYHFISESLHNPKYKCVYINYEGAFDRFKKVFFAHVTGVYPYDNHENHPLVVAAEQEYLKFLTPRKDNFQVYDGAGNRDMPVSTDALEIEISKLAERGYRAFFIDTINSIDNKDNSKGWEITERAMRMLERVAKRYELCIIATAQNKQGLEFEDQKWPDLKWIGQSQTLQQKPGAAIGIYRADIYSGQEVDYTTLAIIKTRHRTPFQREGVNVSYDKYRRMLVPYKGKLTDVSNSSEGVKREQILAALRDDIDTAFADM